MKSNHTLQLIASVIALVCLVAGWINIFPPEISGFLYKRVFYAAIGISLILQTPQLTNRNFIYPMYLAAGLCIIGAFLPFDSRFSVIKSIGLFAGVIISIFNRQRVQRNQ
ncbi:MAG: hypothetical protein QM564_04435 [Bergeyella sp.]